MFLVDSGTRWYKERVIQSTFHTNEDTKYLIYETEITVSVKFENGDQEKALMKLQAHPVHDQAVFGTIYRVGLYSGCLVVLSIAAILSAFYYDGGEDWHVVSRIYRGPFVIVEIVFFTGLNFHVWQTYGINHIKIFDMDPKDHLSKHDIFEITCLMALVWVASVLGFLHSSFLHIPPYTFPLAMVVFWMMVLLNPFDICWSKARLGFMKIVGRTFISPTFRVYFSDYWIADQMISLWLGFMDWHFFFCFFIYHDNWTTAGDTSICLEHSLASRSVAASIPAVIRLIQCLRLYRDTRLVFPHIANAGKYCTTICVFIFLALFRIKEGEYSSNLYNPYFGLWVLSSVVNAIWAYLWDIMIDFGLFDSLKEDKKFLKDEMIFPHKGYYYFAIVEDFILRYNWLLLYLMTQENYVSQDFMFTILSPVEVFRRFIWNIFRLENEHIKNRSKYQSSKLMLLTSHDDPEVKVDIKGMKNAENHCRKRKTKKKDNDQDTTRNGPSPSFSQTVLKRVLPAKLMKGSYKFGENNSSVNVTNPSEIFVVKAWQEYN